MAKYKSVILVCGPRAEAHIKAYEGIDEIHLNAACDKNETRLNEYGKRFKIPILKSYRYGHKVARLSR